MTRKIIRSLPLAIIIIMNLKPTSIICNLTLNYYLRNTPEQLEYKERIILPCEIAYSTRTNTHIFI